MIKIGLDMYLKAKLYMSKYTNEKLKDKRDALFEMFGMDSEFNTGSVEVSFQIGYWRKANAIHKWFVDNCQDGVDECQESYVEDEDIKKLLRICKEIQKDNSKAEKLLSTKEGFFFGGTEYDEYYFDDIKQTIEILEKALKLSEDGWEFYYQSSW